MVKLQIKVIMCTFLCYWLDFNYLKVLILKFLHDICCGHISCDWKIPIGGILKVNKLWLTCTLLLLVFSAQMVHKLNSFTSSCILPFTFRTFAMRRKLSCLLGIVLQSPVSQGVCDHLEYISLIADVLFSLWTNWNNLFMRMFCFHTQTH